MNPRNVLLRVHSNSAWDFFRLIFSIESEEPRKLLERQTAHVRFLQSLLHEVYQEYMRNSQGCVEVLELQQDCKDWGPEW